MRFRAIFKAPMERVDDPNMGRKVLSILALLAAILVSLSPVGCDAMAGGTQFVAKAASFGKWEDKRPSGSIIMHDMLILTEPREYGSQGAPLGFYVVTTSSRMASKINEVVTDRIPSARGLRMNFAIGDPVAVRIEKVVEGGKRQLVRDSRAAFLEITR